MRPTYRILSLSLVLLASIVYLQAQQFQPVQMAGLWPDRQLRWQRLSPTAQQPDGPVLYTIIIRSSATPQHLPKISGNYTLMNSLISDDGTNVYIGGVGGTSINGSTGIISFASGQNIAASSVDFGSATLTGNVPLVNLPASATPAANTIPVANNAGKIAAGWLPASNYIYVFNPPAQTVAPGAAVVQYHGFGPQNGWAVNPLTGQFACPQTGLYLVQYHASVSSSGGTLQIAVNGSTVSGADSSAPNLGASPQLGFLSQTALVQMNAGDVLTLINAGFASLTLTVPGAGIDMASVTIVQIR